MKMIDLNNYFSNANIKYILAFKIINLFFYYYYYFIDLNFTYSVKN